MCNSFSEYSRCFKCSKRWDFSYHTIYCPEKRCGLPKPQVIPPLVNNEPGCLECKISSRAHVTEWLRQHELQPLLWNPASSSWNAIWGAPK